ncbi:MAG: hypothetical protein IJ679_01155, partial [Lachnospiraceae bacterium]|nr:hypothetical protein [Lachnospiraceae bacterium]
MHEIRIRTPAAWELLAALLMTLALLAKPMDARAAADDITVTMDAEIALTLDNSNPANKKMTGEGAIYGACENGASHGFVRATIPDALTMTTPAGNKTAPAGMAVEFAGSINARKGRANY